MKRGSSLWNIDQSHTLAPGQGTLLSPDALPFFAQLEPLMTEELMTQHWLRSSWVIGLDGKSFPNDLIISRMVDGLDIFLETLTDFNSLSWCWRFLLMNIAGMRHCHSNLASMYLRVDFEQTGHLCFVSADTCSILLGWKLAHWTTLFPRSFGSPAWFENRCI